MIRSQYARSSKLAWSRTRSRRPRTAPRSGNRTSRAGSTDNPRTPTCPHAQSQKKLRAAIDPAHLPVHLRAVFRARVLVDRIVLAACVRWGEALEPKDRTEALDTIASLGMQAFDKVFELSRISSEERPTDCLAVRGAALAMLPTVRRALSMEIWREVCEHPDTSHAAFDRVATSFSAFEIGRAHV